MASGPDDGGGSGGSRANQGSSTGGARFGVAVHELFDLVDEPVNVGRTPVERDLHVVGMPFVADHQDGRAEFGGCIYDIFGLVFSQRRASQVDFSTL